MKYGFKCVEPCYTGGGIYLFAGTLDDGRGFIAGSDMNASFLDVEIKGYDPDGDEWNSMAFPKEHIVKDLDDRENDEFMSALLDYVIEHGEGIEGNYLVSDMEELKKCYSAPVFFPYDKWEVCGASIYYGESYLNGNEVGYWDGTMRIKVGEYGKHSVFINPEIDISPVFIPDKNGNFKKSIDIKIHPFPEGEYIFDFEPLGNDELFKEEIESMWEKYRDLCIKNYEDIETYFEENMQKMIDMYFSEVQNGFPEEYDKYIRLSEGYVADKVAKEDIEK